MPYIFDGGDNAPMCGEMVDSPLPRIREGRMIVMEQCDPFAQVDPNKNCHEYCRYSRKCKYWKGSNGAVPEDCAIYYKIEDILADARDILIEERRAMREAEEGEYD